jgi:pimeloyl-ACP methyl ester carboxylesterase
MNAINCHFTKCFTFLILTQFLVGLALAGDSSTAPSSSAFVVKITGSGRPMILIPGMGCGGEVWDATVEHFKDHYECHVLTLAGFAGQPAIGAPFLPRVRTELQKYIEDKKLDHPVIIGHSLGGFLAYWLAASAPQKVGPVIAVDGLPFLPQLFNPVATPESMKPVAEQFRAFLGSQSPEAFAASNRKALESMITDPKNLDATDATGKKSDPKAVGQATYEMMTIDLRPMMKDIRTPVLLLGASSDMPDPAKRAAGEAIYRQQVAAIPNHKVVFAPNSRHFIQLDQPQFFYTQVEAFVKEPGGPATK